MTSNLTAQWERLKSSRLSDLSSARAGSSLSAAGWTLHDARQFLDESTVDALIDFASSSDIAGAIDDLFSLKIVNPSENRPASHWALRSEASSDAAVEALRATLDPALTFAEKVRSEGKFKTVLHLGIGGSDFGPRLLHDASSEFYPSATEVRFAANVDPLDLDRALRDLDPKTTLVIGVSKSFSSEETMYNLQRTKSWMEAAVASDWPDHFALVTASPQKAESWLGRSSNQIFDMPESVGGRFSLWSNASLACMIAFGKAWFSEFLSGARDMDTHVRTASLRDNLALRLALYDYWNMTIRNIHSNIVLGYSNALRMLPTYLQQLELESNGKRVQPDGEPVPTRTISGLWGGEGTIGQHSYHQWLHQGDAEIAAEFILTFDPDRDELGNRTLISHALAQAEVLANGRSEDEISVEEPGLAPAVKKQKVMPGGKPSLILTNKSFNASVLGALIALYEHRTYLAGRLWRINSFDQWGVERGKVQASKIKAALAGNGDVQDPVTHSLVQFFS